MYPKRATLSTLRSLLGTQSQSVFENCSPQCLAVKNALSLTSGVATITRAPPKRLGISNLQEEFNADVPGLKPLCSTRWTVRTGAINSILKNYDIICTEMEQVSNESGDSATHASGHSAFNGDV